ncbi:hypothetical protein GEMRC1_005145 [Eukaryota sp. GEM-RC1]
MIPGPRFLSLITHLCLLLAVYSYREDVVSFSLNPNRSENLVAKVNRTFTLWFWFSLVALSLELALFILGLTFSSVGPSFYSLFSHLSAIIIILAYFPRRVSTSVLWFCFWACVTPSLLVSVGYTALHFVKQKLHASRTKAK